MLNFYKCYRAYIRGKVIGFQLGNPNIGDSGKEEITKTAKKYFDLSHYYASLFSHDIHENRKPVVFIVRGLSGTGKSTIASKISTDYYAHLINTDVVRKPLEGIDEFERYHDDYNTGLYSSEKRDLVYQEVMKRARSFLENGENVVLDATFIKRKYRDIARELADKANCSLANVVCECPETVVKQRLEDRLKGKSVSDGRWEIYLQQKQTCEDLGSDEKHLVIDTSNNSYDYRMNVFRGVLKSLIL